MRSKIRVEFDFDKSEPYIQLFVDDTCPPNEQADMRDTMLKHFVQRGNTEKIVIHYDPNANTNDYPQLRLVKEFPSVPYILPVDYREEIEINHIKINATYHQSYGSDAFYENGKAYNLMFSTAPDNNVMIKYGGHVVTTVDTFFRYKSLAQFLEYWTVTKTE